MKLICMTWKLGIFASVSITTSNLADLKYYSWIKHIGVSTGGKKTNIISDSVLRQRLDTWQTLWLVCAQTAKLHHSPKTLKTMTFSVLNLTSASSRTSLASSSCPSCLGRYAIFNRRYPFTRDLWLDDQHRQQHTPIYNKQTNKTMDQKNNVLIGGSSA